MLNHEAAMVAFIKLAGLSQAKRQLAQRDKFLLLAGLAALDAGYPEIAARCRQLVLSHNPAHLVRRYDSLSEAARDAEFQTFQKQLAKLCSYERAEHLLTQLDIAPGLPTSGINAGDYALLLLGKASS